MIVSIAVAFGATREQLLGGLIALTGGATLFVVRKVALNRNARRPYFHR